MKVKTFFKLSLIYFGLSSFICGSISACFLIYRFGLLGGILGGLLMCGASMSCVAHADLYERFYKNRIDKKENETT
jgi:hypothetical protein